MSAAVADVATFTPVASLIQGRVHPGCRACVTIPARNEEGTLQTCLDALADQQDALGRLLAPHTFEVLLLLNNCTDSSRDVVRAWSARHPALALHVVERSLPDDRAHAGWARRLLMDTAWQRLGGMESGRRGVILTTDADSVVARDWITNNVAAVDRGADAVGGAISIRTEGLTALPANVQACYRRDRRYAELLAQLEAIIDPQAGDPWPRHADHFGCSLACTVEAYALSGGMPPLSSLEDEAFVDALRRANLCLRHDPAVRVYTSARLEGRARVGLAGQLRLWNALPDDSMHFVQSAAFLRHRFTVLARLREAFATSSLAPLAGLDLEWKARLRKALRSEGTVPAFLMAIDCNALVEATYQGLVKEPILHAIAALEGFIRELGERATGALSACAEEHSACIAGE